MNCCQCGGDAYGHDFCSTYCSQLYYQEPPQCSQPTPTPTSTSAQPDAPPK